MLYRSYTPASPLADFVEDFWLYEDYRPALPVSELIDTHVDLEALWGRSAPELRDRLRKATTPIDKFRVLEAALVSRLSGARMPHGAVVFAPDAFRRSSPMTVRDVTERVGLSQRRFIEVFKAHVGLTPKLFHRVQRFQLIRDFVAFSGFSPGDFARHQQGLRRQGVHLKRNHLPLTA